MRGGVSRGGFSSLAIVASWSAAADIWDETIGFASGHARRHQRQIAPSLTPLHDLVEPRCSPGDAGRMQEIGGKCPAPPHAGTKTAPRLVPRIVGTPSTCKSRCSTFLTQRQA